MINRKSSLATAALAASTLFFASGCGGGLIPFTHELREQQGLTNEELKNLQWYVSHRITLRRQLESGGRQVTGTHKLLVVSGKTIEEVVIEQHTPGIAVNVTDGSITVSFEQGSSLDFSAQSGRLSPEPQRSFAEAPEPFPGNNPDRPSTPAVATGLFSGNYFLVVEPGGKVRFQTRDFEAVEDSFQAHLMIDSDTLDEVVENRKVLKGLRLPSK
ncbi:MAG: DNA-directed RNA polymerase [Polyangiaceae bacterium]|nr:DNA-directed RNA polymerase [Polyangiaceae bacterium]